MRLLRHQSLLFGVAHPLFARSRHGGNPEKHFVFTSLAILPLFFSALRPLLRDFGAFLGPDHLIVAYLDDLYILGPDDGISHRVELFLSEADTTLCLNSRSETHSLDTIRDMGLASVPGQLGTPSSTGTSNLNENSSSGSPASRSKHTMLLLRISVQQNLRHQRSLYSAYLTVLWDRLGSLLRSCVHQIPVSRAFP